MRAYRLRQWQQPATFEDVPRPTASDTEVLVRVGASGACRSDLHLQHYPPGRLPFDLPFTLGHEVAGWVEATGPAVSGWDCGTPVVVYGPWGCGRCRTCRVGCENHCTSVPLRGVGLGVDGGHASHVLVADARLLVGLGDLDPRDAAPLADAGLTSYHAVRTVLARLGPGSTAVVIGIGGLGHLAVQYLRVLSGATVIAVDREPGHVRAALDLGADVGIPADSRVVEEVRGLTAGRGADVVLDVVGTDGTVQQAVDMVAVDGDVVVVGMGGATLDLGRRPRARELRVAATYWGSIPELVDVVDLARRGLVTATTTEYRLEDAVTAYRALAAGTVTGRAVLVP